MKNIKRGNCIAYLMISSDFKSAEHKAKGKKDSWKNGF